MANQLFTRVDQVATSAGWVTAPSVPSPPPELDSGSDPSLFAVFHRSIPGRPDDGYIQLRITSSLLLAALKRTFRSAQSLYKTPIEIDGRTVFVRRAALQASTTAEESAPVRVLVDYLEQEFAHVAEAVSTYPAGYNSWSNLWSILETGAELQSTHEVTEEPMALILDSWEYVQESTGRCLKLSCHYYQWAGTTFHRVTVARRIDEFEDLRPVTSLAAFPLSSTMKEELRARGSIYLQYASQVHATYTGWFFTKAYTGASRLLGDGEVIIDVAGFRKSNPSLDNWGDNVLDTAATLAGKPPSRSSSSSRSPVTLEEAHLLPPSLHGFSLRMKRWGEFLVSNLSPIRWAAEDPFSHLVLPSSARRVVKSLVSVYAGPMKSSLLKDVVEGKGTGLVMAFAGSPGTGKTLTAEAVSHHLRRPLYTISAAELGITPREVETQLKNVLTLAASWNAVLLIDEADIFLTKRDTQSLERNALVGIFLRSLEYFSGILILTTNHIAHFDAAFISRFAVTLQFAELDQASRQTLWERFLRRALPPSAELSAFDLSLLAAPTLNGRDIFHAVQTAQALSLVDGQPLQMSHLAEALEVAKAGLGAV